MKSPGTIGVPAAAFSQFVFSKPAGFGTGAERYGYHYGFALGDKVNGKFMRKFVFASAAGHLEAYEAVHTGGSWKGIRTAVFHTVYACPPDSFKPLSWSPFNCSDLLDPLASAEFSNLYQPAQQRSWSAAFARLATNGAGYAGGDEWDQLTYEARNLLSHRSR